MEYSAPDIRTDILAAPEIVKKVQGQKIYAQNLYAAFCNQQWQKALVWPLLKNEVFSMSWRSAGAFIAKLRGTGDYLDWYCSGISADYDEPIISGFVPEGTITAEVRCDLAKILWHPVENQDN